MKMIGESFPQLVGVVQQWNYTCMLNRSMNHSLCLHNEYIYVDRFIFLISQFLKRLLLFYLFERQKGTERFCICYFTTQSQESEIQLMSSMSGKGTLSHKPSSSASQGVC